MMVVLKVPIKGAVGWASAEMRNGRNALVRLPEHAGCLLHAGVQKEFTEIASGDRNYGLVSKAFGHAELLGESG